jgi:nitrate reductase beta subunit
MQSKKKSTNESKPLDCFRSIDTLPIKIWFDIHHTGDYRLLLKEIVTIDADDFHQLFEVWQTLYNQHIEMFGLSEEFIADLNNQIQLANYKAEFIITGDRYFKTLIKVEEAKIAFEKGDEEKPMELEMLLAKMSKYYGFKLESRELTVVQYYSYLKNVKNG